MNIIYDILHWNLVSLIVIIIKLFLLYIYYDFIIVLFDILYSI